MAAAVEQGSAAANILREMAQQKSLLETMTDMLLESQKELRSIKAEVQALRKEAKERGDSAAPAEAVTPANSLPPSQSPFPSSSRFSGSRFSGGKGGYGKGGKGWKGGGYQQRSSYGQDSAYAQQAQANPNDWRCWNCDSDKHLARDCPKHPTKQMLAYAEEAVEAPSEESDYHLGHAGSWLCVMMSRVKDYSSQLQRKHDETCAELKQAKDGGPKDDRKDDRRDDRRDDRNDRREDRRSDRNDRSDRSERRDDRRSDRSEYRRDDRHDDRRSERFEDASEGYQSGRSDFSRRSRRDEGEHHSRPTLAERRLLWQRTFTEAAKGSQTFAEAVRSSQISQQWARRAELQLESSEEYYDSLDSDPSSAVFNNSPESVLSQGAFNNGLGPLSWADSWVGRAGIQQPSGFNSLAALTTAAATPALQVILWTLVTLAVTMLPSGTVPAYTLVGWAQSAVAATAQLMTGTWLTGLIAITVTWSCHQAWLYSNQLQKAYLQRQFPASRRSAMARRRGTPVFRRDYTLGR